MTLIEFAILLDLNAFGGLTAQELCDGSHPSDARTRQGFAAQLVKLERRGFVTRAGSAIWRITDRGREWVAA